MVGLKSLSDNSNLCVIWRLACINLFHFRIGQILWAPYMLFDVVTMGFIYDDL